MGTCFQEFINGASLVTERRRWKPELTDGDGSVLATNASCNEEYLIPFQFCRISFGWSSICKRGIFPDLLSDLFQGQRLNTCWGLPRTWRTLCTAVKTAEPVWLSHCASVANMLTQPLSFLSTIWDGNFPIRIFPISLRNLGWSPLCRPGFFSFSSYLTSRLPLSHSYGWPWSRHWHMLKGKTYFPTFVWPFKIGLFTVFSCVYKP